jgi:drug/metabolite transporter (DMT)-like permease
MISLILVSIIWALSFGLIKFNLTNIDPNLVAFLKVTCALPIFLPFLQLRSLPLKDRFFLLSLGGIQYGLMYILCIRAYHYLQAYEVSLFTAFTPLYVVFVDSLYRRRLSVVYLVTACMSFIGGALIYYHHMQSVNLLKGFLLVQAADMCFAWGQVAYKYFRKNRLYLKDYNVYALLFFGAAVITAISTTLNHGWAGIGIITSKQWLTLMYVGTLSSGICFFLWNKAATKVDSGTLAICNNIKVPLGVLFAVIVFGEQADLFKLVLSFSLISAALWINHYWGTKKPSL